MTSKEDPNIRVQLPRPGVVMFVNDLPESRKDIFGDLDPNTTLTYNLNSDSSSGTEVPLLEHLCEFPWFTLAAKGWLDAEVRCHPTQEKYLTLNSTDWLNNELDFSVVFDGESPLEKLPASNPDHVQPDDDSPSVPEFPRTYLINGYYIDWRKQYLDNQIRVRSPEKVCL